MSPPPDVARSMKDPQANPHAVWPCVRRQGPYATTSPPGPSGGAGAGGQSYTVRYVVLDTGGWFSERKVLLSPIGLRAMDWEHKRITAALTKAQVEKSPDIDTEKPVPRQHETAYYGYYGYTPYWAGSYLWGAFPLFGVIICG